MGEVDDKDDDGGMIEDDDGAVVARAESGEGGTDVVVAGSTCGFVTETGTEGGSEWEGEGEWERDGAVTTDDVVVVEAEENESKEG